MVQYNGWNLDERERVTDIQDQLIELFVDHKNALATGMSARAREIECEIDRLLQVKSAIEKSGAAS